MAACSTRRRSANSFDRNPALLKKGRRFWFEAGKTHRGGNRLFFIAEWWRVPMWRRFYEAFGGSGSQ
jgi:hypothetical protein